MIDETRTDFPGETESPVTAGSAKPESPPGLRSAAEARQILSEHLKLMLEKPSAPWGEILAWSEGDVIYIPSHYGHTIRASNERKDIDATMLSLIKSKGFTGEPTRKSCTWNRHYTQISPESYYVPQEGGKVKLEAIKPKDRQIISYIGKVSGDYEIYANQTMSGIWFISVRYSKEDIEEGYKNPGYSKEKAEAFGLKPPEPSKANTVWPIYRSQRTSEVLQPTKVSNQIEIPLPPPFGHNWSRATKISPSESSGAR